MPSSNIIETVLLRSTKIIIFVVPVLPLFVASYVMFPYITGKNFIFRIVVEFAAVFWLGLIYFRKKYRFDNSPIILSVLIFTLIVGLADLLGVNPHNSFWSNYERMEGYITILHLALFFLLIKSIFTTRRDWVNFFGIFVIVSIIISLFTIIEPQVVEQAANYMHEYGSRQASTIGNPPFLAAYLLLSVFLSLILIQLTRHSFVKLICVISIIINTVVMYQTAARGAIIAAVVGVIIYILFLLFNKFKASDIFRFRKVALFMLGILIISSIIYGLYQNIDLIQDSKTVDRFMMMSSDDPSIKTRLESWEMAWNGFKAKPLLGWGQENFIGVYTVNPISHEDKLIWIDRAHNIILDWLINAGILGLFSYLAIFGSAFYVLWHNFQRKIISKNETFIITTAIIVYFIQNLFTFDTISTYIIFFALIAYIDNIASIREIPPLNVDDTISLKTRLISVSVSLSALIVFTFITYFISYIPIKQLQSYSQTTISVPQYNSFSTMLDDFNEALSYDAFGNKHIIEQLYGVSHQIIANQLYDKEGALKIIQRTIEELEKGLAANQHNLEYIFHVYSFYELLASYDPSFIPRAEALIEKCLRINPEYERIDMNKVNLYFLKEEYENAYIKLKKFVEQYPNNEARQFKLALASILTARKDEMEKALETVKNIRIASNYDIALRKKPVFHIKELNMLAKAHFKAESYQHALKYYKEILFVLSNYNDIPFAYDDIRQLKDEDKKNIKARVHMEIAEIYKALGDKDNAKKESERAKEFIPESFVERYNEIFD